MNIIVLDFETHYSKGYSLSSITTEEYVRHEQFETIGVAVKVNGGETQWFTGPKAATKKFLDQFPWDDAVAVAHNAMFDMSILNWQFDIRPKRIADTLSMARALHGTDGISLSLKSLAEYHGLGVKGTEVINALGKRRLDFTAEEMDRYGAYCINDVELTHDLFMRLADNFPPVEFRLIDLTLRMFTEPKLELDRWALVAHLAMVKSAKEKLMSKLNYDKADLMSNPKLAELLEFHGVEVPMKVSPANGKQTYAFAKSDEAFKELLEHENPMVQAIVAARLGVKSTLEETRTERFIHIADRGTLPIPLRYYAAHTGRWGGDDKVNMQNLPRKSPLKKAICAPDGYLLVDCDSSQIEARTLAWLAGQDDLVEAFDRGEDVYKIMASAIYNKAVEEITEQERFVGKTTILGCLAEGTPVLTDRGWVAIEGVTISDQLWDGEEWVCHQGLVPKGIKETLNLCGLWLTPDHKVLCGTQWLEAQSVVQDKNILSQALDTGAVSWLYPATSGEQEVEYLPLLSNAIADDQSTLLIDRILKTSEAHGVRCVLSRRVQTNAGGNIAKPYQTINIGNGSLVVSAPLSHVAIALTRGPTQTTGEEALVCAKSGVTTAQSFFGMPKLYPDGITLTTTWTEQTITEGTNLAIFGLSRGQTTMPTVEKSVSFRRNLMTYDIAYAGPRNRYTVATDAGPIIVHNCGYGMGAAKFKAQLKTFGVDLELSECEYIINVYRETYPMIPKLWKEAGRVLDALMAGQTAPLGRDGVLMVDAEGIKLPNGLYIKYPNMRREARGDRQEIVYDTKKGKATIPTRIYGGKCVENVCQALARIVIGEQMLMIARRLPVVMTVHDAVGALVKIEEADAGRTFVEQCMRVRPKWATGLPLNCESKMGASYGG
jgi:DNA polymerase III epsilon subunit-like protein